VINSEKEYFDFFTNPTTGELYCEELPEIDFDSYWFYSFYVN